MGQMSGPQWPVDTRLFAQFHLPVIPVDSVEDPPELVPSRSINHGYKGDSTREICPKIRVTTAVLRLRSNPSTIGEDRFKSIIIHSFDIRADVHDNPGDHLPR